MAGDYMLWNVRTEGGSLEPVATWSSSTAEFTMHDPGVSPKRECLIGLRSPDLPSRADTNLWDLVPAQGF
eukprot:4049263-Amphidinium_carterae.1